MFEPVITSCADPSERYEVEAASALREAAGPLRGLRVLHLSSTCCGTATAALLRWLVPLSRALGIESDWQALADPQDVRRAGAIATGEWRSTNYRAALTLQGRWDVCVVHDLALALVGAVARDIAGSWLWRPAGVIDPAVADRLGPYLADYDGTIVEAPADGAFAVRTGVDPLAPANAELTPERVETLCRRAGIDPDRPLVLVDMRFASLAGLHDAISVYRQVKPELPALQCSVLAPGLDDTDESHDADLHLHAALGACEINALRSRARVVLLPGPEPASGLDVLEAAWKAKPVVARRTESIERYVEDGVSGLLAENAASLAEHVRLLLTDDELAQRLGSAAHRHVQAHRLAEEVMHDWLAALSEGIAAGLARPVALA